jgi:signal-transduction protein with cAMP-binding, CBS, and nucleotidyltransferase domain
MYKSSFTGLRNFIKKDIELSQYQWRILKSFITVKHYKKGELITCDNNIVDSLFFINYGIVTAVHKYTNKVWFVYYNYRNTKKRKLKKDYSNVVMQDFCSYFYQAKSRITFKVYEDCEVLQIKYEDLKNFFERYYSPQYFMKFITNIENQRFFKQLDEQFRDDPMESLVIFKHENKYLSKNLDSDLITEYLNIDKIRFEMLKRKRPMKYSEIRRREDESIAS